MKKLKNVFKIFTITLVLAIAILVLLPFNRAVAQAATIELNKKECTLEIGETAILKLSGTTKTATWTTSDKTIAVVSKKGLVTAKKEGTATITATVNKKKYNCKVTVNEAVGENPYITYAPFAAKEATLDKVKYVIPKDWVVSESTEDENTVTYYAEATSDEYETSSIYLSVAKLDFDTPDYSVVKEVLGAEYTKENINTDYASIGDSIDYFKTSDYKLSRGTAFKMDYNVYDEEGDYILAVSEYHLFVDGYIIYMRIFDLSDYLTPNVYTIGEYLLNSIQISK